MAECVPLGAALQWQRDHVIGVADTAFVLIARQRIGTSRQHGVDRVEAVAPKTGLWPLVIEVQSERERLAFFNQTSCGDDFFGAYVVERAGLIVRTPLSPVFALLRRLTEDAHVELAFGILMNH